MLRTFRPFFVMAPAPALLVFMMLCASLPAGAKQQAQDLGPTAAAETITASLVLKVNHPDLLEAFTALSQDPHSPLFHRFLSLHQFTALFSPSERDIDKITKYLNQFGIEVTEVYADRLLIKATGTADAFDQAFSVDMHDFAKGRKRFHHPRHAPRIPLLLRDLLVAVAGLSNEPQFHPMHRTAASARTPLRVPPLKLPPHGPLRPVSRATIPSAIPRTCTTSTRYTRRISTAEAAPSASPHWPTSCLMTRSPTGA